MRSHLGYTRLVIVGVALGMLAAAALVSALGFSDSEGSQESPAPQRWERIADPPLTPRSHVIAVWTGREALFVGGDNFVCPPSAACTGDGATTFSDGASFDPATQSWRAIADAPAPLPSTTTTAVVDNDVYFLVEGGDSRPPAFLRYSIADDSWDSLPGPPTEGLGWYRLVETPGHVVAYAVSNEGGASGDFIFTPSAGVWSTLPESPLGPAFDRHLVGFGPHLYLFDHELVDRPGSERPSLTRLARLDPVAGTWERLPDSPILASGPWFRNRAQLVNPLLGGADGGAVNNWGRSYPYGGILDTDTESWRELPNAPHSGRAAGAVSPSGVLLLTTSGQVLDVATERWFELAGIPGDDVSTRRNMLAAGPDAIAVGGERWAGRPAQGEVLEGAWIWRSNAGR